MAKAKAKPEQEERPTGNAIESLLLCALIMVAAIGGLTAIGNSLSETFEAAPVVEESNE